MGVQAVKEGTSNGGKKAAARKTPEQAWSMLNTGTGYAAEVGQENGQSLHQAAFIVSQPVALLGLKG